MNRWKIITILALGLLITTWIIFGRPDVANAGWRKSEPPFSIAKCDEWMEEADESWRANATSAHANLATACYLSHMVPR